MTKSLSSSMAARFRKNALLKRSSNATQGNMTKVAMVVGIDFSGASDAGKKILVAECALRLEHDAAWILTVLQVRPACSLPGGGVKPHEATAALCARLQSSVRKDQDLIVGIDSPPSIAARFVKCRDWQTWAAQFSKQFPSPDAFRQATSIASSQSASRVEPKRETDKRHRTPFPPQNLRMYRQTWWAISGVYSPLASNGFVVVPCMKISPKKPIIFEACPASLLKRLGLYATPYKGAEDKHSQRRKELLRHLKRGIPIGGSNEGNLKVEFRLRSIVSKLVADNGGDFLDAVLAAVGSACATRRATFPAPSDGEVLDVYKIEACVYC